MVLDRIVLPTHHEFFVNVEEEKFNGSVLMYPNQRTETSTFKFTSKNLELTNLEITKDEMKFKPDVIEANEFVTVFFDRKVVGDFTLFLDSRGLLRFNGRIL